MDKALKDLIEISNSVGKDLTLVQGGGGNTSVKTADGKFMYIKASGTALKDMSADKGWRKIDVAQTLSILQDARLAKMEVNQREAEIVNRLSLCCVDGLRNAGRPSVEAHLHAILDKYVIHLHPHIIGVYVNSKNGREIIEKLFADQKKPVLWIDYTDPGFTLAKEVSKLVSEYVERYGFKPEVLFLAKHGIFISADNANAAKKLVGSIIKICKSKLKFVIKPVKVKPIDKEIIDNAKLSVRRAFFIATGKYVSVSHFLDAEILAFMARKDAKKLLSFAALTPDEMVYANGPAVWLEKCDSAKIESKLKSQIANGMKASVAFLVNGLGLFTVGKISELATIKDIVKGSLFIRSCAVKLGGIDALNSREQHFINNWEAEAFRKAVVSGRATGELKNRIAIVTGAGSGLGRSLAVGMARAGANVALADIDDVSAKQTAELIKNELPGVATMVLKCNVTNADSVSASFAEMLNNWGGLDILINAAGVAPAFSLTDLPVEKWRFALEVNLTGYFLMAQKAAQIMIEQGMGGSIINLSSKSGIDPSKNNTPYNATKAGELHMSRGWAMELGSHNIRVNSICPGNVFEGSKIWNPEYIKVCAKKYGIKPEEVIPYYVSKTMLNREIKGQDIADAAVFLASDKAKMITAQTLVVDAGQAMVR